MAEDFSHHGPFAPAAEMIDNNQHTDALLFIARHFGLDTYVEVFEAVATIQNRDGSLQSDLDALRYRWSKNLRNWVANCCTDTEKQQLQGLV